MRRTFAIGVLALSACRPNLEDGAWLVDSVRVLAVKSEPAEARPGEVSHFSALLSATDGAQASPIWRFCTQPKPITENNRVASACLSTAELVAVGRGVAVDAHSASDACSLFGPDTPPGGFRPRDPDVTGGYYQPLRVDLPGAEPLFHLLRIQCGLSGAAADVARQFGLDYLPNQNPHLAPIIARVGGHAVALDQIPSGAQVELEASWEDADAEAYAYYDRDAQVLTTRRESLRVAWYVSAGELETQASGSAEDAPSSSSRNSWRAPALPSASHLWVILRDSRGGTDFATDELVIPP